jgi:hypothetical protein
VKLSQIQDIIKGYEDSRSLYKVFVEPNVIQQLRAFIHRVNLSCLSAPKKTGNQDVELDLEQHMWLVGFAINLKKSNVELERNLFSSLKGIIGSDFLSVSELLSEVLADDEIFTAIYREMISRGEFALDWERAIAILKNRGGLTKENVMFINENKNRLPLMRNTVQCQRLAHAIINLQEGGIVTEENISAIIRHTNPDALSSVYVNLHEAGLLNDLNRNQALAFHAHFQVDQIIDWTKLMLGAVPSLLSQENFDRLCDAVKSNVIGRVRVFPKYQFSQSVFDRMLAGEDSNFIRLVGRGNFKSAYEMAALLSQAIRAGSLFSLLPKRVIKRIIRYSFMGEGYDHRGRKLLTNDVMKKFSVSSVAHFTPNHRAALLAVDGSLIVSHALKGRQFFGLNKDVIDGLKTRNVKYIYLFTEMSLSDMQHIPFASGAYNYITRYDLVSFLESEGFVVRGVITHIDLIYQKGLGKAYEDFYVPAYRACIKGIGEDAGGSGFLNQSSEAHLQEMSKLVTGLSGYDQENHAGSLMAMMFRYFADNKPGDIEVVECHASDAGFLNLVLSAYPNVEASCVGRKNRFSLYVPGVTPFERLIADIGSMPEEERNNFILYQAPLSDQQLKLVGWREVLGLVQLYKSNPLFKAALDGFLNSENVSMEDFLNNSYKQIYRDPRAARNNVLANIMAVIKGVDSGQGLPVVHATLGGNQRGFSCLTSEMTVFEYFSQIQFLFAEKNLYEYRKQLVLLISEAKAKLGLLPSVADKLVLLMTGDRFDGVESLFSFLRAALQTTTPMKLAHLFFPTRGQSDLVGYQEIIKVLTNIISKCDQLLHARLLPVLEDDFPKKYYLLGNKKSYLLKGSDSHSISGLCKQFFQKYCEVYSGMGVVGLFGHSNINPDDGLEAILRNALHKKSSRSNAILVRLKWLNEDGETIHDAAPSIIKETYKNLKRSDGMNEGQPNLKTKK